MAYDTQSAGSGPEPITDWANDWDWLDDQWGSRAPEIWAQLREQGCPVAFTARYGRAFMPITHEAVSTIAHDTEHYSSFRVSVALPDSPVRKAPPTTTDPPDHTGPSWRRNTTASVGAPRAVRGNRKGRHIAIRPAGITSRGHPTASAATGSSCVA